MNCKDDRFMLKVLNLSTVHQNIVHITNNSMLPDKLQFIIFVIPVTCQEHTVQMYVYSIQGKSMYSNVFEIKKKKNYA